MDMGNVDAQRTELSICSNLILLSPRFWKTRFLLFPRATQFILVSQAAKKFNGSLKTPLTTFSMCRSHRSLAEKGGWSYQVRLMWKIKACELLTAATRAMHILPPMCNNNKINSVYFWICENHVQGKVEFVQAWCTANANNRNQGIRAISAILSY